MNNMKSHLGFDGNHSTITTITIEEDTTFE